MNENPEDAKPESSDSFPPKRSSSCTLIASLDQDKDRHHSNGIFRRLSRFFALGFDLQPPRYIVDNADDCRLLPVIIMDLMMRVYSPQIVIRDLESFSYSRSYGDGAARVFLRALLRAVLTHPGAVDLKLLARIMVHRGFDDLLTEACKHCHHSRSNPSHELLIESLKFARQHHQLKTVLRGKFAWGELRLVYAARQMNMKVARILLQYGADVVLDMRGQRNVFVRFCMEECDCQQRRQMTQFFSNNVSVLELRDVEARQQKTETDSVPDLTRLARSAVRTALFDSHQLPDGIGALPLPKILKSYVDVSES